MKLKKLSKIGACVIISSVALGVVASPQSAKAFNFNITGWINKGWKRLKAEASNLELSFPRISLPCFKSRTKVSNSSDPQSKLPKTLAGRKLTLDDIDVQLPHFKNNGSGSTGTLTTNDGNNPNDPGGDKKPYPYFLTTWV